MPHTMTAQPRDSVTRRIVWLILALLSLAGLVVMTVSGIQQRNYVKCNADQVAILIQYQHEASIAAREEREAHDAVRRAQRDQDKVAELKAIDEYFVIRQKADARRAANPLPDLPQNVCGSKAKL
jgi:heme-degrading monooxygenase HmoA